MGSKLTILSVIGLFQSVNARTAGSISELLGRSCRKSFFSQAARLLFSGESNTNNKMLEVPVGSVKKIEGFICLFLLCPFFFFLSFFF